MVVGCMQVVTRMREVSVAIIGIWAYHKGVVLEEWSIITLCSENVLKSGWRKIKHLRVTLRDKLIEFSFSCMGISLSCYSIRLWMHLVIICEHMFKICSGLPHKI